MSHEPRSVPGHEGIEPGRGLTTELIWAGIAGFIAIIFLLLSVIAEASGPSLHAGSAMAVAAGGVGLAGLLLLFPRGILYGFIALCMVFPHELEELFIPLGFMRLYPQDAVFFFFLAYCSVQWLRGKATLHGLKFNKYLWIYMALGAWAAVVGLALSHNAYDYVFGDLRRSFFYFLAYFFVLMCTGSARDLRYLKWALLTGALLAVARGLGQAVGGDFVMRRFGDAAHILNHFEVTFSTFAVYYGLTRVSMGKGGKFLWLAVAVAGITVVILANFRTCWVGMTAGLIALTVMLPARVRWRILLAGMTSAIAGAIVLSMVWHYPAGDNHSSVGENILAKADIMGAASDQNISWRMDSYRNALRLWQENPVLGTGLGKELEFITATSTGTSMMAMGHRVHNSFLWLLMSLGLPGFAYFLFLHGRFLQYCRAGMRSGLLDTSDQLILLPCLALYVTIMVSACFDVYLESSPPITIVSTVMALCLLTVHYAQIRKSGPGDPVLPG